MFKIKKEISLTFYFISLIFHLYGQNNTDCQFNVNRAISYLQRSTPQEKKALKYLMPCLEVNNALAQITMARMLLNKKSVIGHSKAFELLKDASESGNQIAMNDLADLYKYGIGCKLNFNKARKWYLKSFEYGNNEAAYGLGYLYLKGFGNIKQDYEKAIYWFKKSSYPMAQYWLGLCYYFGYGVPKNISLANKFLSTNFNENQKIQLNDQVDLQQEKVFKKMEVHIGEQTLPARIIKKEELLGEWKGTLLLMDWSDSHFEHKVPITINFNNHNNGSQLQTTWTFNEQVYDKDFTKIDNTFFYNDFSIEIPHTSFKKEIPKKIEHLIVEAEFSIKKIKKTTYLTAEVESYIKQWKENGVPIRLLLIKNKTDGTTEKELSDQSILNLTKKKQKFIKLYPNPFDEDLVISYNLLETQNTTVFIEGITNSDKKIVKPKGVQKEGNYTYLIEGNTMTNGVYAVSVITNNKKHTRILIKK